MGILDKLRKRAIAGSYIPPKRIALYVRRRARARLICRHFPTHLKPSAPDKKQAICRSIVAPDFLTGARRQLDLTASMYAFDAAGPTLTFLRTLDQVDLNGVRELPWRVPGAIPASDVNRAYFISFVEQAPLATRSHPQAGLQHLADIVRQLRGSAQPTKDYLTIPWQPLPAARRMVNLLIGLAFALEAEPSLVDSEATQVILDEVAACSRIVDRLREDDLGYNHLATAIFGQCFYAAAIGDPVLLAKRSDQFVRAMLEQVGADGMQLERSCTYQAHMLGHIDVLLAGKMFTAQSRPAAEELAGRMRRAQQLLTHYDGGFAIFNDSAEGDGPSSASLGALPDKSVRGLSRLDEAGFVRLDDGRSTILFDVGKCAPDDTPGHAHADFLSVEVDVRGRRFVVDPGTATYKAGADRDWTRSSHSHNGPALEGLEPIEFFGAFRVARRGSAFEVPSPFDMGTSAAGEQTGLMRFGYKVRRAVGFWPEQGAVLLDVVSGRNIPQVRSKLIIPAEWTAEQLDDARWMFALADSQVVVSAINAKISCVPGRYYLYGPKLKMDAHDLTVTSVWPAADGVNHMATLIDWSNVPMRFTASDAGAAAERLSEGLHRSTATRSQD